MARAGAGSVPGVKARPAKAAARRGLDAEARINPFAAARHDDGGAMKFDCTSACR